MPSSQQAITVAKSTESALQSITIVDARTYQEEFEAASDIRKQLLVEQECHTVVMLRILHQVIDENYDQIEPLLSGSGLNLAQLKAIFTIQAFMLFSTQSDTIINLREFQHNEQQKKVGEIISKVNSALLSDAWNLWRNNDAESQFGKFIEEVSKDMQAEANMLKAYFLEEDLGDVSEAVSKLFSLFKELIDEFFKLFKNLNSAEQAASGTESRMAGLDANILNAVNNLTTEMVKTRFRDSSRFNAATLKKKLAQKKTSQASITAPKNLSASFQNTVKAMSREYQEGYEHYFDWYDNFIQELKKDIPGFSEAILSEFYNLVFEKAADLRLYTGLVLEELALQKLRKTNYKREINDLIIFIWLPLYNSLQVNGDAEFKIRSGGNPTSLAEVTQGARHLPSLYEMLVDAKLVLTGKLALGANPNAPTPQTNLRLTAAEVTTSTAPVAITSQSSTALALSNLTREDKAAAGIPTTIPGQISAANFQAMRNTEQYTQEFIKAYLNASCCVLRSSFDFTEKNRSRAVKLFNTKVNALKSLDEAKALFEVSKPFVNQFRIGYGFLLLWNWLVGKQHSNTWRLAMKQIRTKALELLKAEIDKASTPQEKLTILRKWRKEDLFKQHRNECFFHGAWGRTRAIYEYIDPEIQRNRAFIQQQRKQTQRNNPRTRHRAG